jgi:FkbM family methyltransferase
MSSQKIDLVVDVGANVGQYAQRIRTAGYEGRIVSFEPLSDAFETLSRNAADDPRWEVHRLALGEEDARAEINISANSWSSSLLPMRDQHLDSAPESAYIGREEVRTVPLASLWEDIASGAREPWLKLDVQGYELHVLRGAEKCLDAMRVIQAELELVPLYEGDPSWRSVLDWLQDRGFSLGGVEPGFEDPRSGRLLQFDGTFLRTTDSSHRTQLSARAQPG